MTTNRLLFFACGLALSACNASHGRGDDAGSRDDDAAIADDAATGEDAGPRRRDDAGPRGCVLPEPEQHRSAAATCDTERPLDPITETPPDWSECDSHDDCTDGTNGRCTGNSFHGYACTYDRCFADAECADRGGPCLCRGEGGGRGSGGANHCVTGNCQTDADCGPGGFCSPTLGDCGDYGGTTGYYCHTCEDECTDDADCGEGDWGRGYCRYDSVIGHWRCASDHCAG